MRVSIEEEAYSGPQDLCRLPSTRQEWAGELVRTQEAAGRQRAVGFQASA